MQFVVNDSIDRLTEALTSAYTALNGDLRPLNQSIADWLQGSTTDRFRTKTAPDGSAWAALSEDTIKRKGNDNILIESYNLLDSITSYYTDSSAVVGTAADYAPHLHFGTEHIDAREIFGISDEDEHEILDLAADFAAGAFDV